jgi:hypothetical protein
MKKIRRNLKKRNEQNKKNKEEKRLKEQFIQQQPSLFRQYVRCTGPNFKYPLFIVV